MMNSVIWLDLDGTIANCEHRLHLIEGSKKDWKSFYKSCSEDKLEQDIFALIDILYVHYEIYVCTGRDSMCREETTDWLNKHGIYYDKLYMRKEGDFRPDYEVKMEILDLIEQEGKKVFMAFEDRDQVVKALRDRGIRVLQVQNGNY